MKNYEVKVTLEAKALVRERLLYILLELQNEQAYKAVKADYLQTLKRLSEMAGSIRDSEESELAKRNLKKIFFDKHDYLLLYRLNGFVAEVVGMFHMREQYWKKMP